MLNCITRSEQFRRTISKLELEVQEAKLVSAAETTKWNQVQDKLGVVEAENVKLKKELLSSHNEFVKTFVIPF